MAKEKKPNPALEKYKFNGEHRGGICGKCGIEYNLDTVTEKTIEAMISKGSPLFEKKESAEKSTVEGPEDYTGKKWTLPALKEEAAKRDGLDTTGFTGKAEYQAALIKDDADKKAE